MRIRRCSISPGLLLFMLLATFPAFSQEHLPAVIDTPIPRSYFGVHVSHPKRTWPSGIAFGGWRVINNNVLWLNLEPHGRKQWEFGHLDELVDIAEQHHVAILYTLGYTPAWASARPNEQPGRSAAEPRDMQDWRDFVQTIATRYKGRIHDWEIWNEANDRAFYSGSTKEMVKLAQAAYEILKQVDSNNIVVSPSLTYGMRGTPWLEHYLRAGGGQYADVIGYHLYIPEPEDMLPVIQRIRSIMAANGVGNKPIWNTETGRVIQNNTGDVTPARAFGLTPISSAEAGAYAVRAFTLAWDAGVSRYYWYTWDGQPMSMLERDGTPKGAAVALAQAVKWLSGAVMKSCDSDSSDTWICHITRDAGYNGYIVWNTGGERDFSIPAAWHVRMERDMYGTSPALKGSTTTISTEPVLFENQAP
ncbi:MAG: endo-1,4-beta-xylanase [Candidatus Sulfotelmatobacter sp.]